MIISFSSILQKKFYGSTYELLGKVFDDLIEKSEVKPREIDGLFLTFLPGVFDGKPNLLLFSLQVSSILGIKPRKIDIVDYGGPSALTLLYRAYRLVEMGEINNGLIIVGGKSSVLREKKVTVDSIDKLYDIPITPNDEYFRVYEDLNPISDYALVANRHKALFDSTDEQRASIAAKQRKNAIYNEKALYKEELSLEQVLSSRVVCDPLRLLEIVYPIDGFNLFLVSRKGRNTDFRDLKISFYNEAHWPEMPPDLPDIIYTPAIESSRGVSLSEIDAFELYDSFTITVLLQAEDIGLTEKGKGGKFFEDTDISYKGEMPVNTGGGTLNTGQPAFMSGGVLLEEALLQLNNMAKGHQVKDVRKVLINGIGGWNRGHSVTVVIGEVK